MFLRNQIQSQVCEGPMKGQITGSAHIKQGVGNASSAESGMTAWRGDTGAGTGGKDLGG